uniref:Lipoate-protein ligase A n=1 Tax=Anthurium amnicola TaxID=1678845 RepID=A0A1D1XY30_9ARAE
MASKEFSRGILLLSLLGAVLASELRGHNHIEPGRSLVEGQNEAQPSRTLVRTARIDPLDGFKKYRGGYNITNKNYWSSTVFTGIYGYGIALLCLLGGLVYACFLFVTTLCCFTKGKNKSMGHPCPKSWSMPIGVLFTLLAIVASVVVLVGSSRFNSRANSVKNIIEETAHRASGTIYNVTSSVKVMEDDPELSANLKVSKPLSVASRKLNDEASNIRRKAEKNVRMISRGLKILNATTLGIVSLNMVSILALLGSDFLKLQRPFHLLIVLSWLLTTLCWAHFGLYFFLDRFAGDTCVALDEYRQDPRDSSLSTILPCNNRLAAKSVLRDTRAGIHDLIAQVNANISALQSSTTLPNVAYVCNPFSAPPDYDYQPESCSSDEIRVGDIPQVLKRYACSDTDGGTCGDGKFISASDYNRVQVYTTSVQNLLNSFPGVERLVNCQLVKDAFSDILSRQCRPLERYAHMSWAAMATLSTIMVFLVLTWVLVAYGDSKHHTSNVNPHFTDDMRSPDQDANGMVTNHKVLPLEP